MPGEYRELRRLPVVRLDPTGDLAGRLATQALAQPLEPGVELAILLRPCPQELPRAVDPALGERADQLLPVERIEQVEGADIVRERRAVREL